MTEAKLKTVSGDGSVADFLAAIPDVRRREEALSLDALYRRVTGLDPRMWGPSIVGYGQYRYRYETGREGTMCRGGFSPRKAALTLYLTAPFGEHEQQAKALLDGLGPHKEGKACLYISRLGKVDQDVLENLVALNWAVMNATYPDP